jgi:hypothetical protein
VLATIVFSPLVGGPPQLRTRDAAASLRRDIDAVVLFQLAVWAVAGMWVTYRLAVAGANRTLRSGLRDHYHAQRGRS